MNATLLSRFSPGRMQPEALEKIFVKREKLARRIVDLVLESCTTASKHHTLFIGPRGIGKSHLISIIYHRVRALDEIKGHILIAWLQEEETGVMTFLDLLLRIFRALSLEYTDLELEKSVESLYELDSKAAEQEAADLLKRIVDNRTLLVFIENLDEIFLGLGDVGQKKLRAYIQENPFISFIATAQSLFNGVQRESSPFYGFFRIEYLKELNVEDAIQLLSKVADLIGDPSLASFINTPKGRARIRAIHHLAGGNPRIYIILGELLTSELLDDLVTLFMRTIDDLTPYYQSRMSWLSLQQRKIVEFLCQHSQPVSVKLIAKRCFMTQQTASSQLKSLREMGYVHSMRDKRESYYELKEPLMRLCFEVKRHRNEPIKLLIDFLRLWHSQKELQERLSSLTPIHRISREYLIHAIQKKEEHPSDVCLSICLEEFEEKMKERAYQEALAVSEEIIEMRGNAQDWYNKAHCYAHLDRYEEATIAYRKSLELDPVLESSIMGLVYALRNLEEMDEQLALLNNAIEHNNSNAIYLREKGLVLSDMGRLDEGLEFLNKALEIAPKDAETWLNRGYTLWELKQPKEAIKSFRMAIKIEPKNSENWGRLGVKLLDINQFEKALKAFDRAIKLNRNDWRAWTNRGVVFGKLGQLNDSLASFNESLKINPNDHLAWYNHGSTLRNIGRSKESLESYEKAIKLDPLNAEYWTTKGCLLDHLDRYKEGLEYSKKAVELDSNREHAWDHCGKALYHLGRIPEALEATDKAITLERANPDTLFRRATLLLELTRWEESIVALGEALLSCGDEDGKITIETTTYLSVLLKAKYHKNVWRDEIDSLLNLYKERNALISLGVGLVRVIPAFELSSLDSEDLQKWCGYWSEIAGRLDEFALPLHLLQTAVSYLETRDASILIRLPMEERKLLIDLLKVAELTND